MAKKKRVNKVVPFEKLYPELSPDELEEAEANFKGYLDVVLEIYEEILEDPEKYAEFKRLTSGKKHDEMKQKRSEFRK